MAEFLVDANLPKYFNFWSSDAYIHVVDLGSNLPDTDIWAYAKVNGLTIISKDSDFSSRIINADSPPKVSHIRIGNMKINELYGFIKKIWNDVLEMNSRHKLVNVYRDKILGVD